MDYASKRKENIWAPFLSLLNRSDGFIINMSSRILAKLACWGTEQMPKSDVHFYLQWLKDQLVVTVSPPARDSVPFKQCYQKDHVVKNLFPLSSSSSRFDCAFSLIAIVIRSSRIPIRLSSSLFLVWLFSRLLLTSN